MKKRLRSPIVFLFIIIALGTMLALPIGYIEFKEVKNDKREICNIVKLQMKSYVRETSLVVTQLDCYLQLAYNTCFPKSKAIKRMLEVQGRSFFNEGIEECSAKLLVCDESCKQKANKEYNDSITELFPSIRGGK